MSESEQQSQPQYQYEPFAPEEQLTDAYVARKNPMDPANPTIEGGWTAVGMLTYENGGQRVHVIRPLTDEAGNPQLDSEGKPKFLGKAVERERFTELQKIGHKAAELALGGMDVRAEPAMIDHVPGIIRQEEPEPTSEDQPEVEFKGDPRRVPGHPLNPANDARQAFADQLRARQEAHDRLEE